MAHAEIEDFLLPKKRSFWLLGMFLFCLVFAIPMGFPFFKPEAPELFQGFTWLAGIFSVLEQAINTEKTRISTREGFLIVDTQFLFTQDRTEYPPGSFDGVCSIFYKPSQGVWFSTVILNRPNSMHSVKFGKFPVITDGTLFSPKVSEATESQALRKLLSKALGIPDVGFSQADPL